MEFLLVLVLMMGLAGGTIYAILAPETRERISASMEQVGRSLPGRLFLMGITGAALMIPLSMVESLRQERGHRLVQVQHELASEWGQSQRLVGPMLRIPALEHSQERFERTSEDGNVKVHHRPKVVHRSFLVLPRELDIRSEITPQALHRGLYDVLVYGASVELDATFARPELAARPNTELEVLWHEAELIIELSDLSSVSGVTHMDWQRQALQPVSGALEPFPNRTGIRAKIPGFEGEEASVRVSLDVRGMNEILVGALGETSRVEMSGEWHAPSFTGFTLPVERTVEDGAFSGRWSVPGVARPVPQVIELSEGGAVAPLLQHTVGVRLVEPASPYVSVERALTYGALVIFLCLLTFLVLENSLHLQLHPVQWLVNGLALVVFYLILLATSEHQGFQMAYGMASVVTVGLISGYIFLSTLSYRAFGTVVCSLTVLYGTLFGMLRSEAYALLTGTGLVVLALACTMWVTRRLGRSHEPVTLGPEGGYPAP
jgi:inner membrane protein